MLSLPYLLGYFGNGYSCIFVNPCQLTFTLISQCNELYDNMVSNYVLDQCFNLTVCIYSLFYYFPQKDHSLSDWVLVPVLVLVLVEFEFQFYISSV